MLERLLVPLDTSKEAEMVLPYVTALAKALQQPIVLLTVIMDKGELDPVTAAFDAEIADMLERRRAYALEYLGGICAQLEAEGVWASAVVIIGPVAESILATADAEGAEWIAMATHGRTGLERWYLGSVADVVVRTATKPVLVIRPGEAREAGPAAIRHLLLPLDGSHNAEVAIPYATALARTLSLPVTVVRTLSMRWFTGADPSGVGFSAEMMQAIEDDATQYLEGVAERLRADGIQVETHVAPATAPAGEITDLAIRHPGTLVIMGTHGRSGISRTVLGSVTDRVVRSATAPVLVVPSAAAE